MKLYEIVIIGRQALTQQQMEALVVGLTFFVTQHDGEVIRSEYCGHRRLEYQIKKNQKGHYYVLQIKLDPNHIKELERIMGLNEDIIRFLVVRTDCFETREHLLTQAKFFNNSTASSRDFGYRNANRNNVKSVIEKEAPEKEEVIVTELEG